MNLKEIKELIELISDKGFAEIEIERQGFRLRLSRFSQSPAVSSQPQPPPTAPVLQQPQAEPVASPAASPEAVNNAVIAAQPQSEAKAAAASAGSHVLTSPIVGTFYRSPSPDADPFVEVGSRVKKGQVLCIIEAMKLMNEIESDVDGVIAEIYPQNAQAVEFGEPLFAIRLS
ncbi:MAG TPA: acetyl-CoA carboxylase biotin carboxyl carrier protein [Blastocatellia bacterium]|nr:acetyl-CoA carboxylase biotin carboxyl carrier protein [Blastocatellia bacterium]